MPSNRHPLNVRSDTGPDLGGGSELGAAPIFLPAAAQGERSGAASPWTPTGLLASLALHSLPTAWGHTRGPYGRRKRAQRSLVRRGTDAARPPATPSAAGCAGAAPGGADAPTADGPRGARPRARAATRWRPLRRHGGRTPSRARTEPRTSPRAGRGAWWRLPCGPLTGRDRPRRLSPEQKRRAAGSQGHTQGAVPTPCGKEEPDGLLRIRYR